MPMLGERNQILNFVCVPPISQAIRQIQNVRSAIGDAEPKPLVCLVRTPPECDPRF